MSKTTNLQEKTPEWEDCDDILWSDCPEELYLQQILQEQESAGKGKDSLMGESAVENIILVEPTKPQGTVSRWTDWAPIAGSTTTDGSGAKKSSSHQDDATPASKLFDPNNLMKPSEVQSKPPTPSTGVKIQPKAFEFDEYASTVSIPDPSIPDIVDFDEDPTIEQEKGMSTLSGDTGIQQTSPQIDYTSWWIPADDVTYAKPRTFRCNKKHGWQKLKPPSTPSTQQSGVSGTSEGTGRVRCGFFRRAADDKVFRRIVSIAIFLLVLFVVLAVTAMVKTKESVQGGVDASQEPLSNLPSFPTQTNADDIPPTDEPSTLVEPEPDQTSQPTLPLEVPIEPIAMPSNMQPSNAPYQHPPPPPTSVPSDVLETPAPTPFSSLKAEDNSESDWATLTALISEKSPNSLESLSERSSPQFQALQWMTSDVSQHSLSDERIIQRWAMAVVFYSTRGHQWTLAGGWLTSVDECRWFTTSDENPCDERGRVTRLDLRDNKLQGTLPREIELLSNSLVRIYFNSNDLRGTLPTTFGRLTNLERLYLTVNNMNGLIPTEIGQMTNLEHLGIGRNEFSGRLPSQISQSRGLRLLDMAVNKLTGTIPSQLGGLTQLEYITLRSNTFSGSVPSELGQLSRLEDLKLSSNRLSGAIPDEICLLTSGRLEAIDVDCSEIDCECCSSC